MEEGELEPFLRRYGLEVREHLSVRELIAFLFRELGYEHAPAP